MDKWALGQGFCRVRRSSLVSIIPPQIHTQILLAHHRRYIISVTDRSIEYKILLYYYIILYTLNIEYKNELLFVLS